MSNKIVDRIYKSYIVTGYIVAATSVPFFLYTKLPLSSLLLLIFGLTFVVGAKMDWKEYKKKCGAHKI